MSTNTVTLTLVMFVWAVVMGISINFQYAAAYTGTDLNTLTPVSSSYLQVYKTLSGTPTATTGSSDVCAWFDVDMGIDNSLGGSYNYFKATAAGSTDDITKGTSLSEDGADWVAVQRKADSTTNVVHCRFPFQESSCYEVISMARLYSSGCSTSFHGSLQCYFHDVSISGNGLVLLGGWNYHDRKLTCSRADRAEDFTNCVQADLASSGGGGGRYDFGMATSKNYLSYDGMWFVSGGMVSPKVWQRSGTSWSVFQSTSASLSAKASPRISRDALIIAWCKPGTVSYAATGNIFVWSRADVGSQFALFQSIDNPWGSGQLPGWPAQTSGAYASASSWAGGDYHFWGTGIGFSGDGRTLIAESHTNTRDNNNCATPFGMVTVFTRASTSDSFTFQNVMPYSRFKGQPKQYAGQSWSGRISRNGGMELSIDGLVMALGFFQDQPNMPLSMGTVHYSNTEAGSVVICVRQSISEEFDFEVNCQITWNPAGQSTTMYNLCESELSSNCESRYAGIFGANVGLSGDGTTLVAGGHSGWDWKGHYWFIGPDPPATDCVGAYGDFGECTGDGTTCTHTQTYAISTAAAYGGTCANAAGDTNTESCACPVDCVGAFGAFGECTGDDTTCTQTKTFDVTTVAAHGGQECMYTPPALPVPCATGVAAGEVIPDSTSGSDGWSGSGASSHYDNNDNTMAEVGMGASSAAFTMIDGISVNGPWTQATYNTPVKVTAYSIQIRMDLTYASWNSNYYNGPPWTWVLVGSNDGTNFVTLGADDRTTYGGPVGADHPQNKLSVVMSLPKISCYSHYRLVVTDIQNQAQIVALSEVNLFVDQDEDPNVIDYSGPYPIHDGDAVTEACDCPVDCVGVFVDLFIPAPPAGGTCYIRKTFTISTAAAFGGDECANTAGEVVDEVITCPVDCVGSFVEDPTCREEGLVTEYNDNWSYSCPSDNAITTSTYVITTEAAPSGIYNGTECTYAAGATTTNSCTLVRNCEGSFSDWSECTGNGTTCAQSRRYRIKESALNGGSECPHPDHYPETQACTCDAAMSPEFGNPFAGVGGTDGSFVVIAGGYYKVKNLDYDGDGIDDVLMYTRPNIWMRSISTPTNGDHTKTTIFSPNSYDPYGSDFEVLDIDGDGDKDIILTATTGAIYSLDGTTVETITLINTQEVHLRDLDNDGLKDVVLVWHVTYTWDCAVYYNTQTLSLASDGNMKYLQTSSVLVSSWAVQSPNPAFTKSPLQIIDIDNNGIEDFVFATGNQYLEAFLDYGAGCHVTLSNALDRVANVVFGDIDGDGDMDIFIVSYYYSVPFKQIGWMEKTGSGADDFGPVTRIGGGTFNQASAQLVDFDGDNDLDVVCLILTNAIPKPFPTHHARWSGDIVWLSNDGHGVFSETPELIRHWFKPGSFGAPSMWVGDYDGDGDLDIVRSCNEYDSGNRAKRATCMDVNQAITPLNDGTHRHPFMGSTKLVGMSIGGNHNSRAQVLVDLDGDGDDDLVHAHSSSGLHVTENTGLENWARSNTRGILQAKTMAIVAGDLDLDGTQDLVIAENANINSPSNYGIRIALNTDNDVLAINSFGASVFNDYPDCSKIPAMELSDMDNDGDLDLIVMCSGTYKYLYWLTNQKIETGVVSFTWDETTKTSTYQPLLPEQFYMELVDFDNDGCLDWISEWSYGHNQYCKDGTKAFTVHQMDPTNSLNRNRKGMAVGDFNNDGHIDAFVAGASHGGVYWHGDGSATTFSSNNRTVVIASGITRALAYDFDRDGDDDIIFVAYNTQMYMVENDGGAGITDTTDHILFNPNPYTIYDMSLHDFDKDGFMDILITRASLQTTILINAAPYSDCMGEGTFGLCSGDSGSCTRSGPFSVRIEATNGGNACSVANGTTVTESCTCPSACVGEFNSPTTCVDSGNNDGTCSLTKTYEVFGEAMPGGNECPFSDGETAAFSCPCPVDCVGDYDAEWGFCTGDGTTCNRFKSYSFSQVALHGGAECPQAEGDTISESCLCAQDCVGGFSDYGACASDGNGGCEQTRTYTIYQPAANEGAEACPLTGGTTQTQACDCPKDCVGSFGEFGECTGSGTCSRSRSFTITSTAADGGAACDHSEGYLDTEVCPCEIANAPFTNYVSASSTIIPEMSCAPLSSLGIAAAQVGGPSIVAPGHLVDGVVFKVHHGDFLICGFDDGWMKCVRLVFTKDGDLVSMRVSSAKMKQVADLATLQAMTVSEARSAFVSGLPVQLFEGTGDTGFGVTNFQVDVQCAGSACATIQAAIESCSVGAGGSLVGSVGGSDTGAGYTVPEDLLGDSALAIEGADFALYTTGDATLTDGRILGATFIGGNAVLGQVEIGAEIDEDTTNSRVDLIVEGTLDITCFACWADIHHGGTLTESDKITKHSVQAVTGDFEFTRYTALFQALSTYYNNQPNTVMLSAGADCIDVIGTPTTSLEFVHYNPSWPSDNLCFKNFDSGDTLVINFNQDTVIKPSFVTGSGINIIYNAATVTTLTNTESISGSLLAPSADFTQGTDTAITGRVIVKSFSGASAEISGEFGGNAQYNECFGSVCDGATPGPSCVDPVITREGCCDVLTCTDCNTVTCEATTCDAGFEPVNPTTEGCCTVHTCAEITDNTPPTISCPGNVNLEADETTAQAVAVWSNPTTNDDIAVASVQSNIPKGSSFNEGTFEVTYTVTDVAGNTATCSFNIVVSAYVEPPPPTYSMSITDVPDTSLPAVMCPNAELIAAAQASVVKVVGSDGSSQATDFDHMWTSAEKIAIDLTWSSTLVPGVIVTSQVLISDGFCGVLDRPLCNEDTKMCSDGSTVTRDRDDECNFLPCPVACVGAFGDFGACTGDATSCTHTQTFSISTAAAHGGAACSHVEGDTETSACDCDAPAPPSPPSSTASPDPTDSSSSSSTAPPYEPVHTEEDVNCTSVIVLVANPLADIETDETVIHSTCTGTIATRVITASNGDTHTIYQKDAVAPTLTLAATNFTSEVFDNSVWPDYDATDDCVDPVDVTVTEGTKNVEGEGYKKVFTITASDECGGSTSATFEVISLSDSACNVGNTTDREMHGYTGESADTCEQYDCTHGVWTEDITVCPELEPSLDCLDATSIDVDQQCCNNLQCDQLLSYIEAELIVSGISGVHASTNTYDKDLTTFDQIGAAQSLKLDLGLFSDDVNVIAFLFQDNAFALTSFNIILDGQDTTTSNLITNTIASSDTNHVVFPDDICQFGGRVDLYLPADFAVRSVTIEPTGAVCNAGSDYKLYEMMASVPDYSSHCAGAICPAFTCTGAFEVAQVSVPSSPSTGICCDVQECVIQCAEDTLDCWDGSSIARDPTNFCSFTESCPEVPVVDSSSTGEAAPLNCATDTLDCWDGNSYSRDPLNGCAFTSACPPCDTAPLNCGDGSQVFRVEPTCEFAECGVVCESDTQTCASGDVLSRDPEFGCQFNDCPDNCGVGCGTEGTCTLGVCACDDAHYGINCENEKEPDADPSDISETFLVDEGIACDGSTCFEFTGFSDTPQTRRRRLAEGDTWGAGWTAVETPDDAEGEPLGSIQGIDEETGELFFTTKDGFKTKMEKNVREVSGKRRMSKRKDFNADREYRQKKNKASFKTARKSFAAHLKASEAADFDPPRSSMDKSTKFGDEIEFYVTSVGVAAYSKNHKKMQMFYFDGSGVGAETQLTCIHKCDIDCGNFGWCSVKDQACKCVAGFSGDNCEVAPGNLATIA